MPWSSCAIGAHWVQWRVLNKAKLFIYSNGAYVSPCEFFCLQHSFPRILGPLFTYLSNANAWTLWLALLCQNSSSSLQDRRLMTRIPECGWHWPQELESSALLSDIMWSCLNQKPEWQMSLSGRTLDLHHEAIGSILNMPKMAVKWLPVLQV